MNKRVVIALLAVVMMMALTGCCLSHEWTEASCSAPKTCVKCGETEGEVLVHTWVEATCTEPKTCSVCGVTEGSTLGHTWVEATYETPKTCSVCKVTEGDALSVEADKYYEEGRISLYGLGGNEINLELAYNHFVHAKELGRIDANFYLGLLCDRYAYPELDYELAKSYYEASANNPYAQIALGELYYEGKGVEEDKEKAEAIFQTVIDNGYVEGYWGKASIAYDAGDYETELECYNKVLEGTEQIYVARAMESIGIMYKYGEGVEQNYAKALEWFEKAFDGGNASAANSIGFMYYWGEGVEQDYAMALVWCEKAADMGYAAAMFNIGYMYENGQGVELDYVKALEWFEKAFDGGNASAANSIGYMYEHGYGMEQDYVKALEWYGKAADMGNTAAMFNIGYMYEHGEGMEQDYAKALEWYEKAFEAGDETVQEDIERIKSLM